MRFGPPHRLTRSPSTTLRLHGAKPPTFAEVGKGLLGLNDLGLLKPKGGASTAGLSRVQGRVGAEGDMATTTTQPPNGAYDPNLYTVDPISSAISMAAGAACAYHGYKRNDSAGWAFGWGLFGYGIPIIAVPIALAQGFGKPAGK